MELKQIEVQIKDLEVRVERLRALYEQYFLGIERIEPQTVRKDVDRRVFALRKFKVRNTALRFRLNTTVQRYNTYQQYWTRICRQIEQGTYTRHLKLAEKTFGSTEALTGKAKRRKRNLEKAREKLDAEEAAKADRKKENAGDMAALLKEDPDAAMKQALADAETLAERPSEIRTPSLPATSRRLMPPPLPKKGADASLSPKAKSIVASPARPVAAAQSASPADQSSVRPAPGRAFAKLGRAGPGTSSGLTDKQMEAAQRIARERSAKKRGAAGKPAGGGWAALGAAGGQKLKPAPAPSSSRGSSADSGTRPAAAKAVAARRKAVARKAVAGKVAAVARTADASERAANALSDRRVEQLHKKLVATKAKLKQDGKVSVAGLAKSLRATEEKLRKKHAGRTVEFQIVVKGGKAVVKPVLK